MYKRFSFYFSSILLTLLLPIFNLVVLGQDASTHTENLNHSNYSSKCRASIETGRSSRAIEPPEWEGLAELDCQTHKTTSKLGVAYIGQFFYVKGLVYEGRFAVGPSFKSPGDKIAISSFIGATTRGQAYFGSNIKVLLFGNRETEYFPEITFGNERERTFHQRFSQQILGKWLYLHGDSLKMGHHHLGRIGAEIRLRPKKESEFQFFINPDMVIPERTFGLIVGTRFTFGSKH